MGLRDLVLLITIYGSLPLIFLKPFVGVLVWYWLGLMNPHRITWTLENMKVALTVGVVMILAILASRREPKQIPWTPITITLAVFWAWMLFTTFFAFHPELAWAQWDKVWKIMLTTFIAIMMLNSRERILSLVFVIAFSIGFYGFKGGIFTIIGGGQNRVWGPAGSFIADNNAMALAMIMVVPLLFYLRSILSYRLLRLAVLGWAVLCLFAIFSSYSRGGLLGAAAMALFLTFKSRQKLQYLLIMTILAPLLWFFMPQAWHERMGTIETFEQDSSAMGRIMAWRMAFHLALNRPTGGGFETFRPDVYLMYLPEVGPRRTDAHSNYFEVLGEHGFIGLGLWLTVLGLSFSTCGRIVARTRRRPDLLWMRDLAAMLQVSLVGYAVAGLFQGLAYFDLYYALVALVVALSVKLQRIEAESGPLVEPPPWLARPRSGPSRPAPATLARQRLPWAPTPAEAWRWLKGWYARL